MSSLADEVRYALNGTKAHLREINGKILLNVRIDGWWTEFSLVGFASNTLSGKDWNYYNDYIATKEIWGRKGIAIKMDDGWHILRDYYVHNHRNDDIPDEMKGQVGDWAYND